MTTRNDAETSLSSTQRKTEKPRSSVTALLVNILFALLITAGLAFALYRNMQLDTQLQSLITESATLQQQQTDNKARLDAALQDVNQQQAQADNRLTAIQKTLSSALQERWYQNNEWLLLKARYYLELAGINAHWSDNPQTTIALLQQADDLLVNLHEPELFATRQAIAKEMASVQAIVPTDIAGMLAKLDAAQKQVASLSSKNPVNPSETTPAKHLNNTQQDGWSRHLQSSMQILEKLVIIRHHDKSIQPMLSPEYEAILRETIILNLQEAQWAVIQHNDDVFKLALTQAIDHIKRGFDLNTESTRALIKQLDDLQQTRLQSQQSEPGESLQLLNQIINSRKITPPAVTKEPAPQPVEPVQKAEPEAAPVTSPEPQKTVKAVKKRASGKINAAGRGAH